jgi:FXSXX-COOH protein
MDLRGSHIETTLLDLSEVPPDELWWSDDSALSQLLRELVEDTQRGDDGSTVAAFNSSL